MERICDLTKDKRTRVVKLLLRPESIVISAVPAVWTMAGSRPCDAGSGRDFEITEALFDWALASEIAVFIRTDRDAHLVSESFEIIRVEAHEAIYAAYAMKCQTLLLLNDRGS